MPLLKPSHAARRVYELTPEALSAMGVRALILDVDNTLTTHGNPEPDAAVQHWLAQMRAANVPLMILSNNRAARVAPFAERLGLAFESEGAKPLSRGYLRCCERFCLPPEQVAIVGDQIFTDMLGGNLAGVKTILVEPIEPETGFFFRVKRFVERPLLRRYLRGVRRGKEDGA